MSAHHDDDQVRALLAPLDTIEPVTRNVSRRSPRRLLLTLAVAVCGLAAAGVAIAAGLGAFLGNTTIDDLTACKASTIALTTASGAQVLTGHTDAGVYCVAYKDTNGAVAWSAGRLGETTVGQAVAVGALDTASNTHVIAVVVPPGYNELSIFGQQIPIKNQAFVIDRAIAASEARLSGPAGTASINLRDFAGP